MRYILILIFGRGLFYWGMCIVYYICICIFNVEIMFVCFRLFCWDIFEDNVYVCWFIIILIVIEKGRGIRILRVGVLLFWFSREGLFWIIVYRLL